MSGNWNDFNDAEPQQSYDIIPKGTVAPVRMTIKPGNHDDPGQGWTGGYATRNETTGSVYLNAEFAILEGPFVNRRVFSLIGLLGPKGPQWGNMGRAFVRGILNSARGLSDKDNSPQAQAIRRIDGLHVLDGIEFLAKIDVGKDRDGEPKNEIRFAVTPNHKDWQAFLEAGGQWRPNAALANAPPRNAPPGATGAPQTPAAAPAANASPQATAPATPQQGAPQPGNPNRPAWAQ